MGIRDPAEVAKKRLRNASNYIRKKCVGSSYTLGRFSQEYRKSLRIFADIVRGVSQAFRDTFSH
jgi:hypothetical protein